MRVAIVTETFLPKMDGIVRMLVELLAYLEQQGHEALVLVPGKGPNYHGPFAVDRYQGLRWRLYPGLTVAGPSPRLFATLREWQPDILHLAGPAVLGAQAALIGRSLHIPMVAHFQTDLGAYAGAHGLSLLQPLARHYLRTIHGLAERTYCPTPTIRRQLLQERFSNLALCARGVDTVGFHPAHRDNALRAAILGPGTDTTTPIAAYVGRISPEKNLDALLAIAGAQPDLPLLIIGDGPARAGLQSALAGKRAYFTGELRGAQLAAAYASADFLVCTSKTETFCQVAQEAMASQLPTIGFRAGGVQDVVLDGETGVLCDPTSPTEWLAAIAQLSSDTTLRRQLGRRAREVAEGRTWHAVFDRLLGEYQEITERYHLALPHNKFAKAARRMVLNERR